ncbi:sulfite exporter TauE/SafE family protein [Vibrio sp. RC27]
MELLEPSVIVILAIVAFTAGFVDAVAGGGGMLTIPALLSIGLPPHIALGTNKVASTFASSTAAFTYYKKRIFHPHLWGRAFIATCIGAAIGTYVVSFISTEWLEKVLPLVILLTALYTILHKAPKNTDITPTKDIKQFHPKQVVQGSVLGFYDGVAGPGTGAFWTVSSMAIYKFDILKASGLAKAMNFTSNGTSLVTFALLGHIDWLVGLTMGVFLMAGAYVGAHSAIRFGGRFIRPVFISVVSVIALKLAYEAWFIAI